MPNENGTYDTRKIICSKKQYLIATVILTILCILFAGLTIFLLLRGNVDQHQSSHKKRDIGKGMVFFQISDTHLDIYYDRNIASANYQMCRSIKIKNHTSSLVQSAHAAKYGRLRCDTPKELLESAAQKLNDLNKQLKKPVEFIMISGKKVSLWIPGKWYFVQICKVD